MVTKMFGLKKSFIILCTLIFVVSGDISTKDNKDNAVESGNEEKWASVIQSGFDNLGLPSLNEGEEEFEKRCEKYGTNTSYNAAVLAKEAFQECLTKIIDVKKMEKEIEAAKPTGDLDMVFKDYCRKKPVLKGCLQNFTNGIEDCFADEETAQLDLFHNITDSLLNFICFKDGDRIALFIAEGGPDCIKSKAQDVQACVNATVTTASAKSKINLNNLNITSTDDIPEFTFDSEKCGYFTQIQKCVVQVLEDCSEPTPANIVGSLFEFVKKSTPCSVKSTSSSLVFSVMSLIVPLGAIILSRI